MALKKFFSHQIVSPKVSLDGVARTLSRWERSCLCVDSKTGLIKSVESLSKSQWSKLPAKKKHQVIIPGLIDPHTHLVFAGHRAKEWARRLAGESYEEIARAGGGIRTTVKATREASEAHLLKLAKERADRFLAYGVTTIECKSGYGLDLKTELKLLKVLKRLQKICPQDLISTFMAAHALPPEFSSTSEFVDHIIENILPLVARYAEFQDVFIERGYFSKEDGIRVLEAGKRQGLKPKVHAHEFARTGGIDAAVAVGAVSADHLQFLSALDIARMKQHHIVPVILPGTSFFLGAKDFAPARKLWDADLPVAIASDFNPGTNPSLNLPLVGTFAALYEGLTLDEILIAQTYHAALAVDRKDRGRLEAGFRADFVILEAESFEEMYYHYGNSCVGSVYIAGQKAL